MNGPDHYRQAERLLVKAERSEIELSNALVLEAQVHATLALAAATALQLVKEYVELDEDAFAWNEATGTPVRGVEDVHLPEDAA